MDENEEKDYDLLAKQILARRKKKKRIIIIVSIVCLIFGIGIYFFATERGKKQVISAGAGMIYDKIGHDETSDLNGQAPVNGQKENKTEFEEKEVYNIALLGEQDGNTDTMILATLNTKHDTLTLTSLMRDIYVDIPGHSGAKLNAAYQLGGISLFYETIKQNFDMVPDGYIIVDYDVFEYIIDALGGLEVTLTKAEAKYLNHTNYISEKKYRTVKEGTQVLNGNQVLGYCRIRKRKTAENESDDFGRTSRQRYILSQVFSKVKKENLIHLFQIADNVLSETKIKTDINRSLFQQLANEVLEVDENNLTSLRVPNNHQYQNDYREINGKKQSVLIIQDWEEVKKELKEISQGNE